VAKGFTHKEREDYFYTYSPVARLPSIHMLIAMTAARENSGNSPLKRTH
jgi:hypothetical protein